MGLEFMRQFGQDSRFSALNRVDACHLGKYLKSETLEKRKYINKYILSTYYPPDILGSWDISVNKTGKDLCSLGEGNCKTLSIT